MKNIAVFASGKGSNFLAIIKAIKRKSIKARLALLVCDNPQAGAILHAGRAGIKVALIKRGDFSSKKDFEDKIIENLEQEQIDLIALAGYMRILSPDFVRKYKNRIINIHPALLPAFKGAHGLKEAFDYGIKVTGVTVHFVDEEMDHGPIILQEAVQVEEDDTLESLEAKIHEIEHKLYPRAIQLYFDSKIKFSGRKIRILIRQNAPK